MRMVQFSVTNYRSITDAHKINLSNKTILIGKNNEGKSNILRAMKYAMAILLRHSSGHQYFVYRRQHGFSADYKWENDFPIQLQDRSSGTESIFRMEFSLSSEEVEQFKLTIKSSLNGTLTVEIRIGKSDSPKIRLVKRGPGLSILQSKSSDICKFIAERLYFNYIPAIRTDDHALRVIRSMILSELEGLDLETEYSAALDRVRAMQQQKLDKLADKIKTSMQRFVPNIKGIEIAMSDERRFNPARNEFDLYIDDGNNTKIDNKGDGVKSLAALALLKEHTIYSGVSVVAIEEPESHLHPGAIHKIRQIIDEIAKDSQIIISTHNPLFVDREFLSSNIIVDSGKAVSAKNVSQIRDILEIKASDNLSNANFALIVEGSEDEEILRPILSGISSRISRALRDHTIVFDVMGGATNLSYRLGLLRMSVCEAYVLLDDDSAGRLAYDNAERDGLLRVSRCTFTRCLGMNDAELEDCLNPVVYRDTILSEFGVNLDVSEFRSNKMWSERVGLAFKIQAKQWDKKMKANVKAVVASCAAENWERALHPKKRNAVDALIAGLERMIGGEPNDALGRDVS